MGVTLDDVAERAGVSRALVSLALHGSTRVSKASRERVLAAAEELRYRPNLNARRLASHRTGTVGVLISDLHNPVFAELLDGFDQRLEEQRDQVLLASGFRDPRREKAAIESFLALQVDAIVLLGSQVPTADIQALSREIPTVAVGRRVAGVDCVVIDDAAGVRLVMDHLIGLGHARIAHLAGGQGARARSRRRAYSEVMHVHGLDGNIEIVSGEYTEEAGEAGFARLWRQTRPTAIFAANDQAALGVLSGARSHQVTVPTDLSVAGFDDTTLAGSGLVSLTSVGYSRAAMGALAGDLVRARLVNPDAAPQSVVLTPKLAVRSTTAEPRR